MLINKRDFKPKRYSSGELKLEREQLDNYVVDNRVEILFENKLSVFELLLILDYYKAKNVTVDLILSYLPYQRMDHKDSHLVDTLANVENVFNRLDLNSITICEPHSSIQGFNNAKQFSYVNNLKEKVFKIINFNQETDVVVLTDRGGVKRYGNIAKNIVYFNKERDPKTGLIIKQEIVGDLKEAKKVLLVDDIISTGDTIINIVEYLTKIGVEEIYILSGHYEKNKFNKRLEKYENVKTIFSTNSLTKRNSKKLFLIDIRKILYDNK